MKNVEHKNDDGKRYLKKYEIVETDVELPIQGQVRDPEDLYIPQRLGRRNRFQSHRNLS
jgi:hypothetical protein